MHPAGNNVIWVLPPAIWANQKKMIGSTILYIQLTVNRGLFFSSFQSNGAGVSHSAKIICAWL